MTDRPDRIWIQCDTRNHMAELVALAEPVNPEVTEAFQEYLRRDLAAPRVRALQWANEGFDRHSDEWSAEAITRFGFYWVIHETSGCYVFFNKRKIAGSNECWDRDEAKAAAQSDFESRVLACLE